MLSSKSLTVYLVILFVSYSSSASFAKNVLRKTLSQHFTSPYDGNILFNVLSSVNVTHAVFGTCSDNDSEKICKITLSRLDSTDKTLSCNITIKDSKKYTRIEQNATATLLLSDRALVSWKDNQKLTLINVNFHGCSTNEAEVEIDEDQSIYAVNVLAYENSYDIFLANSKLCPKSCCRMTFDNEGNIVKDIAAWGDEICNKQRRDMLRTVAHNSPVNGFIVERDMENVSFVNNEGKKLWTVKTHPDDFTVSTFGNYIGTCLTKLVAAPDPLKKFKNLECKKFDFEGKLIKTELQVNNISSLVGENKTILYLIRQNLPEGFILFTVLCPNLHYPCAYAELYVAYHFDENGKMLKATEINDFKTKGDWLILVTATQNDAGQMCVFLVHYDTAMNNIEISLRCFTDDEL